MGKSKYEFSLESSKANFPLWENKDPNFFTKLGLNLAIMFQNDRISLFLHLVQNNAGNYR